MVWWCWWWCIELALAVVSFLPENLHSMHRLGISCDLSPKRRRTQGFEEETKQEETPQASSPEVHFEPVVKLIEKRLTNLESDEEELIKLRAKSYRYVLDDEDGPQWKERGVGEVKIMKHKAKGTFRIIMRRDKTLKICINHHLLPSMSLKPHCSSDKAFVWSSPADFADEEATSQTLAIKFGSPEKAEKFRKVFEKCLSHLKDLIGSNETDNDQSQILADELSKLEVIEKQIVVENESKNVNGHGEIKEEKKIDILEGKESED
eukprot:gene14353-15849_t